jgi:dTDP-4-amino-4,6-dideoxygalactose transaminase
MMTSLNPPLPIPAANPQAAYLAHKAEIDAALQRVLDSGWYILGEEVAAFEQEFAAWVGVQHAVGVANGTDALELALRACGVAPGDGVFSVANTAVATIAAIERCGATPLLLDVDPDSYTLDPNHLESALQRLSAPGAPAARPKAIIPVHLYGHPADMPAILELAARYGLCVIEDCAQAHGAMLNGRPAGAWGDIAAFSLYPTKNLGALGDGGVVTTNNPELAQRVRLLRQYGWEERYVSLIAGMNSRLDPLQAAVLRVKLRYLAADNGRRRQWAAAYNTGLAGTPLILPQTRPQAVHVYHQYVVRASQREAVRAYLQQQGIGTQILYPVPIHLQPAYRDRLPAVDDLAVTTAMAQQIFTLPIYPELQAEQIEYIIHHVKQGTAVS